jgi:hypothetical protein
MQWRLLGETVELLPFYVGEPGETAVEFHGRGGCFANVAWQPRPVYKLEAVPTAKSHPLSKRVFTVDKQTSAIGLSEIYDRAGKLWKLGVVALAHPDYHLPENKGSGQALLAAVTMLDVQAEHCTTIEAVSHAHEAHRISEFAVSALRTRGR